MVNGLPVTQRAYTLRLRGVNKEDKSWQEALWKTHEAVNKGAKAFGDWLLTLRGGLCHTLAEEQFKGKKPTAEEIKNQRILLALSWLSVESVEGAPKKFVVANDKTIIALQEILKARGASDSEIESWIKDCSASLSAKIRDDAVWINRSNAFDATAQNIGDSFTRYDIWDILERLFSSPQAYLKAVSLEGDTDNQSDEKVEDLVQKAGNWLSNRFGGGKGTDFTNISNEYLLFAQWCEKTGREQNSKELIQSLAEVFHMEQPPAKLASTPGPTNKIQNRYKKILATLHSGRIPNENLSELAQLAREKATQKADNTGKKGNRNWANKLLQDVEKTCGMTYRDTVNQSNRHFEFAVMLDHAARRVSLAHTWIKRAEAQRRQFEEDSRKIYSIPDNVVNWLDAFCETRSGISGAIETYRIRKRAIDGWKEVVKEWSKNECQTEDRRIAAARSLQDNPEIDKFGDIQLFESLASGEAICVWKLDGKPNPQLLIDYVVAKDAEAKQRRFKVPAYRHPDILLHPVFCDFGNSRWKIEFDIHQLRSNASNKKKKETNLKPHGLKMGLWDGNTITTDTELHWSSKRFTSDINLNCSAKPKQNEKNVTRADRLGRAAGQAIQDDAVNILGLFEQKDWNGRLQVPRSQLDKLAKYIKKHGWDDKAKQIRSHLNWLITFSAKLQPQGPYVKYAEKYGLKPNPQYWPHNEENKQRQNLSRLILSRLPELRILSGDLGHRNAMACAVWETLSADKIKGFCNSVKATPPKSEDLYLHLKYKDEKTGKERTTILRRIGPDSLVDKSTGEIKNHPAPWARLERQFLIKLQGEEYTRKASFVEVNKVKEIENTFGKLQPEKRLLQVDELMSDMIRTIRLALKRHGDRARIAFAMTSDYKVMPGNKKYYWQTGNDALEVRRQKQMEYLRDSLILWHDLAKSSRWNDDKARNWWNERIVPLGTIQIEAPKSIGEDEELLSGVDHKKQRKELETNLTPIAEKLLNDSSLRERLNRDWAGYWLRDDDQWKKILKDVRQLILPRGKDRKDASIWHTGGLSLERIATIKMLWQVMKAYRTRPEADDLQKNIPGKDADSSARFGKKILDTMERLREQRVKQLASRFAAAALGLSHPTPLDRKNEKRKERVRRLQLLEQRFSPCHAVVIENLTNYRPEETRTRRENHQLMMWSSSKVKKYLSEACQLNGLHLREVPAGYTSRQDSRTGAPGVRCSDVPVIEFLNSPFWKKQLSQAEKRKGTKEFSARDGFILNLRDKWKDVAAQVTKCLPPLRIPMKSGEIFVSSDKDSPAAKGIQADLNAAANIGLRALLDPDWPGKWWYIPCDAKDGKPLQEKVKGSKVFNNAQSLIEPIKGKKETVNAWRNASPKSVYEDKFLLYKDYQAKVEKDVVDILRKKYLSE